MTIKSIFNEVDKTILELIKKEGYTTFTMVSKNTTGTYMTIHKCIKKLVVKGIIAKKINPKSKRENLLTYSYPKIKLNEMIELMKG